MVFIEQKNNDYIVFLESNLDIDISKIYNQMFFSIYPLKGLRVFKDKSFLNNQKIIEEKQNDKEDIKTEIFQDNEETEEDKIINVFGKEKIPNNYSELPLKNEIVEEDNLTKQNHDDNDEKEFYSGLSGYLTKYLPSIFSKSTDDSIDIIGTKIFIPYNVEYPVYSFDEILSSQTYSDNLVISNNISYMLLHDILRDIYIQIDYLRNNNYYFYEFDTNKIVCVQGRYVYFNSSNLKLIKKTDDYNKELNKGVLDLIRNLLKLDNDTELVEQLKNIQNTQIYYYIKRIEREGNLLWI